LEEDAVERISGRRLGTLVVTGVLDVLQVQLTRDEDVVFDVPDLLGEPLPPGLVLAGVVAPGERDEPDHQAAQHGESGAWNGHAARHPIP
jgi:hypothetical protein